MRDKRNIKYSLQDQKSFQGYKSNVIQHDVENLKILRHNKRLGIKLARDSDLLVLKQNQTNTEYHCYITRHSTNQHSYIACYKLICYVYVNSLCAVG